MIRRSALLLLAVGAALLAAGLLSLQAHVFAGSDDIPAAPDTGYDLSWRTVDGGGATFSEGGGYLLGGTTGQPDAGMLSSGSYTLHGGFWRPACIAAAVTPTITPAGNTVTLAWTHNAANQAYQVHRDTTPYFAASGAARRAIITAAPWSYTDPDAVIGDPNTNYFYLLRATCGAAYADAGRVGEFDFALIPGN